MADSQLPGASDRDLRPDDAQAHQQVVWDTVTTRYRRNVGGWWWGALIAVPALLALVGGALGAPGKAAPTPAAPAASVTVTTTGATPGVESPASATVSATATPAAEPVTFGLSRTGPGITVTGYAPDQASHDALIAAIRAMAPNSSITDGIRVQEGAPKLEPQAVAALVGACAGVDNAVVQRSGSTVTVSGAAATADVKVAVQSAVRTTFPGAKVDDKLTVAAASDACGMLQVDLSATLAAHKIQFETGSTTLTSASARTVRAIASRVASCHGTRLAVAGYTDDVGSAAANLRISEGRAASVRSALIKGGVPSGDVTAKGYGSADPIAKNNTADNRALNRRVEITVK